jgi:hypothetical protein
LILKEGLDDKQALENHHQLSGVSASKYLNHCASNAASQTKAACSHIEKKGEQL